jgi:hypothetical protein
MQAAGQAERVYLESIVRIASFEGDASRVDPEFG